ncbi:hypothetical protein H6P81_010915 [Aristolochia fimbriata]|uniref:Alpha/beta hydrolase fold-3 domain-containing protein n=1 Tax=Aristolochia fimbriata TaxID=158543 RepID=A0AAV7EQ42_ARIFI|nr:hypothetical protein H6P81_010915 [Aristolochia fimbriata]
MSRRKLPIVVYVHGGLYVGGSPFSSIYHPYHNKLASKSKVIVVGVKFRVPPEVPFTTSFQDVWTTLKWVASNDSADGDPWLSKFGDFQKVTLMGDCTGCILVNEATRRAATEPLPNGVTINALVLVHPVFWGEKPIPGEEDFYEGLNLLGSGLWKLAQPNCGNGSDDPMLNPAGPLAPPLTDLACKRVLVCSAEKDWLKFRAWDYYTKLGLSGWAGDAEYWETDSEDHAFHLYDPSNEDAKILLQRVAAFINGRHASSMTSRVTPLF